MAKRALITGITGQDGSYLTELLLAKGYEVHGVVRRASTFNTGRLDHLYRDPHEEGVMLRLHYGDLGDSSSVRRILDQVQPDEFYNLGAQSHVRVSFEDPEYTGDIVATGALRALEAVRDFTQRTGKMVRCYQAGSSEMFGSGDSPRDEDAPLRPRSPYGAAKAAAHWYAASYRESYGLFVCNGILFNHESPRRGETFVTRKVTRAVGRIRFGLQNRLYLGNLDPVRDWGFAGDYVDAMWRMLQQDSPDDYVIATGEGHSVRDFVAAAFSLAGLDYERYVVLDPRYTRPAEVDSLVGNPSRAHSVLGWRHRVPFSELVEMMVAHDLMLAERERYSGESPQPSGPAPLDRFSP